MQVWIERPQFNWIGVWTTHRLMHEHVGKHVKMQEAKKAKLVAQSKHGKQHRMGQRKGMHRANWHHGDVSHKWSHPNKPRGGMDLTTQEQTHGGHKAWQGLDLERQTQT